MSFIKSQKTTSYSIMKDELNVRYVDGCIRRFLRREQREGLLAESGWKVSQTKAHCVLRYVHYSTMQHEVVVVSLVPYPHHSHLYCNVICQLETRWPLHAAENKIISFASFCLSCWLILSLNVRPHIICSPHALSWFTTGQRDGHLHAPTVEWSWRRNMCGRTWSVDKKYVRHGDLVEFKTLLY